MKKWIKILLITIPVTLLILFLLLCAHLYFFVDLNNIINLSTPNEKYNNYPICIIAGYTDTPMTCDCKGKIVQTSPMISYTKISRCVGTITKCYNGTAITEEHTDQNGNSFRVTDWSSMWEPPKGNEIPCPSNLSISR